MLTINEIFKSIQGESSYAGFPCVFVRLTGCNLRCQWCDTQYAFYEGIEMTVDQVAEEVKNYNCHLIEITGGEPLLQKEVYPLIESLLTEGYEVLLETNGSIDIRRVPEKVVKIMDLKCPGSGESYRNLFSNIEYLSPKDEVKFVIKDRADYEWAINILQRYHLTERAEVFFSTVFGELEPKQLAQWILEDCLDVRLQLQMQKYIWNPEMRGV